MERLGFKLPITMLNSEEKKHYNRQLILSEIGPTGQEKLKAAKVLVVGAGGLGCPVLQYLTGAGVGTIGIIDPDVVSVSNLHRQILYSLEDVGVSKAQTAASKLSKANPFIQIKPYFEGLNTQNALDIIAQYDFVIDGTDNFETRYLINDACVIQKKPFIYGAIYKFDGQVSVFNYNRGTTYRCLFPEAPKSGEVPSCAQIGVLGILPGVIGSLQANEALKLILGIGELLSGKLLTLDLLTLQQFIFEIEANPENQNITQLEALNISCHVPENINTLSVDEFQEEILSNSDEWFLLDVREPWEYQICNIENSALIPLDELPNRIHELPRNKKILIYCHHGFRSEHAGKILVKEYGFQNVYNLGDGIHEWTLQIENHLTLY